MADRTVQERAAEVITDTLIAPGRPGPVQAAAALDAEGLLLTPEAQAELADLRRWKAEAIEVLAKWEQVWLAAGQPGWLGGSKADNVRRFIEDMTDPEAQAVLDAAVERRRVLYLMPPDDSSAFAEWVRRQAAVAATYNLALDAYLASRAGSG